VEVVVAPGPEEAGVEAAARIAARLASALTERGRATLAVSGGSTAPPLLGSLFAVDAVDWARVTIWQVDERVAPDRHPDRNLVQLDGAPCEVRPMPVTADDLGVAADLYAAGLPDPFDVVHLGLGDDGHTASWPPSPHPDQLVAASEAGVAVVRDFHGRDRVTLTARVVNAARHRVVLTTGPSKAEMVERWLLQDPTIPIGRLRREHTVAVLDVDAAARLPADAIEPATGGRHPH
jgi:6-phosphogluconolactonase/glucosamine-6-phosphate isomerase/deaminase